MLQHEKFIKYLESDKIHYRKQELHYKDGDVLIYLVYANDELPVYEIKFNKSTGNCMMFSII